MVQGSVHLYVQLNSCGLFENSSDWRSCVGEDPQVYGTGRALTPKPYLWIMVREGKGAIAQKLRLK